MRLYDVAITEEVSMANKDEVKAAPGAEKPTARAEAPKASGVIEYNPGLNAWRAVDATGRCVLSAGKATCIKRFPNFTVKE